MGRARTRPGSDRAPRPRLTGVALAAVLAASLGAAAGSHGANVRVAAGPLVPRGAMLVVDRGRHVTVLDARGRRLRRFGWRLASRPALVGLELAADRRHAFVSLLDQRRVLAAQLYEVELASGRRQLLAAGLSPALSPDGRRLLYLGNLYPPGSDFPLIDRVVVRELATGSERSIAFESPPTIGTPPELVENWSPDGRHAVLGAMDGLRLVDTTTARSPESEPRIGTPLSPLTANHSLAPAYLDARTLVALSNCCIGRQRLVRIDIASGRQTPFATISSPVVTIRRLGAGRLLVVDQLGELLLVSHAHSKRLARGIEAATA